MYKVLRYFCHPLFNIELSGSVIVTQRFHKNNSWGVAICSGRITKFPLQSLKFAGHAECDSTYRSVMHTPTFNVRLISVHAIAKIPDLT